MDNRIKNTLKDMMIDRGHRVISDEDTHLVVEKNDSSQLIIFFSQVAKLNVATLKEYIKELENNGITHTIIIYNEKVTASVNKVIDNVYHLQIELFQAKTLRFNITHHNLYNPHIRLNDQEKQQFIKKYGTQIPQILRTDPICRYFNFKEGDILKIKRKNDNIAYRIVV